MVKLSGKVALITGAANGLGRALAFELHKRGCHLALVDIDLENLEKLKHLLTAKDQDISIHPADVSDEKDVASLRNEVISRHKRLDILINNAAISNSQPFDQLSLNDFKALFEVNFWGTVYFTKYFLDDLRLQHESFLVNIITDFAMMGFPGKTSYGSSKGAIMSFINSLRTELVNTQVKVSLVIPPPLDTQLVRRGKHINEVKRDAEVNFLMKNGMDLGKVAEKIVTRFLAGKYRIVVGWKMYWIDFLARVFPDLIYKMIIRNTDKFNFV